MPVASARPDQNPKEMASQSGPEGPWPTGARWRVLGAVVAVAQARSAPQVHWGRSPKGGSRELQSLRRIAAVSVCPVVSWGVPGEKSLRDFSGARGGRRGRKRWMRDMPHDERSTGVFRRHSYGQVFFLSRLRSQLGRYLGGLLALHSFATSMGCVSTPGSSPAPTVTVAIAPRTGFSMAALTPRFMATRFFFSCDFVLAPPASRLHCVRLRPCSFFHLHSSMPSSRDVIAPAQAQ